MKVAYPGVVLRHKQCHGITTSEPRTQNLEPIILYLYGSNPNKTQIFLFYIIFSGYQPTGFG
jgi:hypothetical protein